MEIGAAGVAAEAVGRNIIIFNASCRHKDITITAILCRRWQCSMATTLAAIILVSLEDVGATRRK